ncbi:MAG: 2OG-Fe(II) oxygenase [Allosphingosinicella sp.]
MAIEGRDWQAVGADLDEQGWSILPGLLDADACRSARSLWREEERFRSRVVMARHGFGRGEYRYFAYPLPDRVAALRSTLYPPLAEVANRWQAALGRTARYPERHGDYLERCRSAGQARPTPLLLGYGPGDYNCLHQDLYGAEAFPLQAAILLSRPGEAFEGGEFLLAEQRPRRQSRATVVPLGEGDAVVFAVSERPVKGSRGWYRTRMKHGVSTVRGGERFTLGLIFHDSA